MAQALINQMAVALVGQVCNMLVECSPVLKMKRAILRLSLAWMAYKDANHYATSPSPTGVAQANKKNIQKYNK